MQCTCGACCMQLVLFRSPDVHMVLCCHVPVLCAPTAAQRKQSLDLMTKAYTILTVDRAGELLGLAAPDAVAVAQKQGWMLDPTASLLHRSESCVMGAGMFYFSLVRCSL